MSSYALVHDTGAYVDAVIGVEPQDPGGTSTVMGTEHDRSGRMSAVVHYMIGTTAGGNPDVTVRVEHRDDGGSWAELPDVNGNTGVNTADITGSTGGAVEHEMDVLLRHAKKNVRAVIDITAANGATSIPISATVMLAGVAQAELPV